MAIIRATVRLATKSGVEKDSPINVWHFNTSTGLVSGTAASIGTALGNFYGSDMSGLWSPCISRVADAHTIMFSQVTAGSPGPSDDQQSRVLFQETFNTPTTAASAVALPSEVAIALSFRGDITAFPEELGATRPAARKRGRVFLGPFNTAVVATDSGTGVATVATAICDLIVAEYQTFITALNAITADVAHVVYSPKNGTVANVVVDHVDNAFDTIRSRGVLASNRVTDTVSQDFTV